jgi:hypothetical protein
VIVSNRLNLASKGDCVANEASRSNARGLRQRNAAALKAWDQTTLRDWLNEQTYREKIQPRLAEITAPAIAKALGISGPYATDIRAGKRRPHARHWESLARLANASPGE